MVTLKLKLKLLKLFNLEVQEAPFASLSSFIF